MPVVDGVAAANTLLSWKTCDPGLCLHYVWQAYKAQGARCNETYPTAYSAWLASSGKHEGDWNPPAGVPVYFGPRSNSSAGDVVISTGNGWCNATDWPNNGRIGSCTLAQRQQQIGRPYLGWTDNMLGNPVAQVQPPEPEKPIWKDDDHMGTLIAARDSGGHVFYFEGGYAKHMADMSQVQTMLWALSLPDAHQFDDGDFTRAIWGYGLEEYSMDDFLWIPAGRPGGFLVASWRDVRNATPPPENGEPGPGHGHGHHGG